MMNEVITATTIIYEIGDNLNNVIYFGMGFLFFIFILTSTSIKIKLKDE